MWGLWLVVGLTAWFSVWFSIWHVHQHKVKNAKCPAAHPCSTMTKVFECLAKNSSTQREGGRLGLVLGETYLGNGGGWPLPWCLCKVCVCVLCVMLATAKQERGGGGYCLVSVSCILNRYFGSIFQSDGPSLVDSKQWRYPTGSEQWKSSPLPPSS